MKNNNKKIALAAVILATLIAPAHAAKQKLDDATQAGVAAKSSSAMQTYNDWDSDVSSDEPIYEWVSFYKNSTGTSNDITIPAEARKTNKIKVDFYGYGLGYTGLRFGTETHIIDITAKSNPARIQNTFSLTDPACAPLANDVVVSCTAKATPTSVRGCKHESPSRKILSAAHGCKYGSASKSLTVEMKIKSAEYLKRIN